MKIEATTIFKRAFRVSHDLPDDHKVAFFDEAQSELVVVNAIGGAIWHLIDGATSVEEIVQILVNEVDGAPPEEQLRGEVERFLASLLSRQAILVVGP